MNDSVPVSELFLRLSRLKRKMYRETGAEQLVLLEKIGTIHKILDEHLKTENYTNHVPRYVKLSRVEKELIFENL